MGGDVFVDGRGAWLGLLFLGLTVLARPLSGLLPRIADQYLHGRPKIVVGTVTGLLFSSFSLMQFFFAPLWGRLSDRIGRRPVLLVGLAGSVVFYFANKT